MNKMNKAAAEALLASGKAKELLLKNREDKDPTHWLLFLATYQAANSTSPDGEWFVLGVHRNTLAQVLGSSNLLRSAGGAVRIYEEHTCQAGDAHQNDDGIWLWDMD